MKDRKTIQVYLDDISESINQIESYLDDLEDFDAFKDNIEKQDAIYRRLEIIGEATKNIPEKVRERRSDIPWQQIAGMRDVLIHEYSNISLDTVWDVINNRLDPLKEAVEEIEEGNNTE